MSTSTYSGAINSRQALVEDAGIIGARLTEQLSAAEEVSWLWPSWLALGKLALVDGDPGLGKSAMTLDLAARVSAGKRFPDGAECEPAGVVLLSAEDGLADTIRPRLDAAGADTSKILALATVPDEDGHDRLLSIPEDLGLIEKGIRRVGARLVVVDPLMAFLSGDNQMVKPHYFSIHPPRQRAGALLKDTPAR